MLNINEKLTTNKYAITTEFSTFFNTIAGKIDKKLIPGQYQHLQQLKVKLNQQIKN